MEFGLVGQTMHQIDERTPVADLTALTAIYRKVLERYFARVQAYTTGYDRDIRHVSQLTLALGGQMTWYGVPDTLQPQYGAHPFGGLLFLRIRTQE